MDYKHRVPGNHNRKRKLKVQPRSPQMIWVGVGVAAVLALLVWWWLRPAPSKPALPPSAPKTVELPGPPLRKPSSITPTQLPQAKLPRNTPTPLTVHVTAAPSNTPLPANTATPTSPPTPTPAEPRFSFYQILPEKEVIIPENEIHNIKRDENLGNAPKTEQYQIQVGSYQNAADAEKLKTQISQLKVKSRIEVVRVDNVDWHRVKIGPFDKLVEADKVRAYLRSNKIDSVVQKAKH
jgi:cell division protein FtsN